MLTPELIEAALRRPLPGLAAQMGMAPLPPRDRVIPPGREARQGGVLILLFPGGPAGELHLVLTRRSQNLGNHRGQISFPGGSVDAADRSTAGAALREACEEVGVCSDDLRLLGDLTPLYIPPSNFCIHPHVAYLPRRPCLQPDPAEVAEVLEVPVAHFLDERNVVEEAWIIGDQRRWVPFFDVFGHKVWGATAMVLAEFVAVLRSASPG